MDDFQTEMQHYRRQVTIEDLAEKGKAGEEWVVYEIFDRLVDDDGGYFKKLTAWVKAPYYPEPKQGFDRIYDKDTGKPKPHPSMHLEATISPPDRVAAVHRAIRKAIEKWSPEAGRGFKTFVFEAAKWELTSILGSYKPVRLMNMDDLRKFTGLDDPAETSIIEGHDTGEASENLRRYMALCLRLEGRTISKALAAKAVGVSRQSIYDFNKKLAANFTLFPTSSRRAEKEPLLSKRNPDIATSEFPEGIVDLTPYNAVQRMNDPDWIPRLR